MNKTFTSARCSALSLVLACLAITSLATSAHAASTLHAATLLPGQIVMSEIMADPSKVSDSAGEWFELYNPFNVSLDLNGLVVKSMNGASIESFTIANAPQMASHDYFVFGRSANTATNGGVTVDYVWGSGLSLGNTSDYLRFERADGTTLLHAAWTGTTAGKSLEIQTGQLPNLAQSNYVLPLAGATFGAGDFGTPGSINTHALGVTGLVAPPVPEPETYAMLGLGLGCIALARSRKRSH